MGALREFHIRRDFRERYGLDEELFSSRGTLVFADLQTARRSLKQIQLKGEDFADLRAEDLYAMGLIDEAFHVLVHLYRNEVRSTLLSSLHEHLMTKLGSNRLNRTLELFVRDFPPMDVYRGKTGIAEYLGSFEDGESGSHVALEEMLMLRLSNLNPAYRVGEKLISDTELLDSSSYGLIIQETKEFLARQPVYGPDSQDLFAMLRSPAILYPDSLQQQLEYIRDRWGYLLGDLFLKLLRAIDYLREVNKFDIESRRKGFAPGSMAAYEYSGLEDYEKFSADSEWMPRVVLLAKSTLVWLYQLSRKYQREIHRLDQIPDEELDEIASRGFNSLWLIGLWERSDASRQIKHRCGNPEAAASAYALFNSEIAWNLGGWEALKQLKERCAKRGIRLASDMVPNHTGIDSQWIHEHPEWFLQLPYPPYSSYSYNSANLSSDENLGIYLEDHYYDQSDAAVVFKRVDFRNGDTRYIYHGNDGTHMPWNDTAQLNYLLPELREAVIQTILHVARNFPIIRFDAAMTLAKKHIHRLWFPEPGSGGDIASRAEHGMTWDEFNRLMPQEFWREVVDRVNAEVPDTLLLAEAFWMMEGYFVRTLGMHRVYNSAFMNMLKNQENAKYRLTIKNTIEFDKEILKRYVNFMNNPDEDTAIAQFGDGDKYFGVCTLMVTMPGLPMVGHGQVEGFTEKYGMEFQRSYRDEQPREDLLQRHTREIFPLMKKRYLFSGVENFFLYDFMQDGHVNENVFAYSNATALERALVVYNNAYEACSGSIRQSSPYAEKTIGGQKEMRSRNLAEALGLHEHERAWCLLREVKSQLWYIRSSRELFRNGLHVSLNGYETQVFMDIHEVWDNEFAHYQLLHDRLEGRGVPDVGHAIREIVLKPVYDAFAAFFTPDYVQKFVDFLGMTGAKARAGAGKLVDGFGKFVGEVRDFTREEEFGAQAVGRFKAALDNICILLELEKKNDRPEIWDYFLRPVHTEFQTETRILGFLILHSLGRYDEEWYLEAKISEILGFDPGLSGNFRWLESYEIWCPLEAEISTAQLSSGLEHQLVLDALGCNYFDGTMWFNREYFVDFCWWTGLYHMLFAPKLGFAEIASLHERSQGWLAMMEKSAYRLDNLTTLANPPVKKVAKKSAKAANAPKPSAGKKKSS